ncbi:DUF2125 domain-containing protein [Phaeobacter sp.]|uniref:DUF2125 domain-containing protein n=1 Tax=Phaeobacter sp. TaxID=1902409 RepID=UPI0025D5744E|nr:DUF2125 domain-containing protein [Phaeobacter sp.]
MAVTFARGCGALIALGLSAPAAMADVSAQDVWADWKSYLAATGYAVSGTESFSGDTLTVSDLTLEIADLGAGSSTITIPDIRFVDNGDGTVGVVLPNELPASFDMDSPDGRVAGTILLSHDGGPMLVSGDADEMTYDFAAGVMTFSLSDLVAPDGDLPEDAVKFTATLSDVENQVVMTKSDLRQYAQSMTSSELSYEFSFADPDGETDGTFKGALKGIGFDGTTAIPAPGETADFAAMLRNGMSAEGTIKFASGEGSVTARDNRDSFSLENSSQGGAARFEISNTGLTYDLSQMATQVAIEGSDIPFPIDLSIGETGIKLSMPVAKSDEEQDFSLGFAIRDFDVPEILWGLVDPTGALPHDPATIAIDLVGKAKLAFDLFDPLSVEVMEDSDEAPGELNALTMNSLEVSVAGAELTGSGDFTFDNSDLTSFDGMPAPTGEANLKLVGANALLDKLIGMGLVSDSDAMGARMMMGLLAVPGDSEDTLTSKIEVSGDGQIKAKGQRIK